MLLLLGLAVVVVTGVVASAVAPAITATERRGSSSSSPCKDASPPVVVMVDGEAVVAPFGSVLVPADAVALTVGSVSRYICYVIHS